MLKTMTIRRAALLEGRICENMRGNQNGEKGTLIADRAYIKYKSGSDHQSVSIQQHESPRMRMSCKRFISEFATTSHLPASWPQQI